ncbi:MAG TPA: hypothetical protein VGW35_13595 [Methylomirabilota bacterium]|nr:hypothetical protein [Methylomirabilota bacterium]
MRATRSRPLRHLCPIWLPVAILGIVSVSGAAAPGLEVGGFAGLADPTPAESSGPAIPVINIRFKGFTRTTGGGFLPLDPDAAVSRTRVLHTVNSAIALYTPTGTLLQRLPLNTFFPADPTLGTVFDPQIEWDPKSQRFFFAGLQMAGTTAANGRSRLLFGVSRSSGPSSLGRGNFCFYSFEAKLNGTDPVRASFASHLAGIGLGENRLVFSVDNSRFSNRSVRDGHLFNFAKSPFLNTGAGCPRLPSFQRFDFGSGQVSLQPFSAPVFPTPVGNLTSPVFFASTLPQGGNQLNTFLLAGSPGNVFRQTLTVPQFYSPPIFSPQRGSNVRLFSGNTSVTGATFNFADTPFGRFAYGTAVATTRCGTRNCIDYYRMDFRVDPSVFARLDQQLRVDGGANNFFSFPSVAETPSGKSYLTYTQTGPTLFPQGVGTTKPFFGSTFEPPFRITPAGTTAIPFASGLGRRTFAQRDPLDAQRLWVGGLASEFQNPRVFLVQLDLRY